MEQPREILLIKNGELALKGLNRSTFEAILMKNIRGRWASFPYLPHNPR